MSEPIVARSPRIWSRSFWMRFRLTGRLAKSRFGDISSSSSGQMTLYSGLGHPPPPPVPAPGRWRTRPGHGRSGRTARASFSQVTAAGSCALVGRVTGSVGTFSTIEAGRNWIATLVIDDEIGPQRQFPSSARWQPGRARCFRGPSSGLRTRCRALSLSPTHSARDQHIQARRTAGDAPRRRSRSRQRRCAPSSPPADLDGRPTPADLVGREAVRDRDIGQEPVRRARLAIGRISTEESWPGA